MLRVGTARTQLNPYWGVELTGWGYYLERRWQRVHDNLYATALAAEGPHGAAIVVSLDLMLIDDRFTELARAIVEAETGLSRSAILLTCTHTHNAPAAGGLLGVGECDRQYEDWAARQAATAAILAWRSRKPALVRTATTTVDGLSFNRTRPNGVVDSTLTAALFESTNGVPNAVIVNYAAHPTVCTQMRPFAVSRDVPGRVCDLLEVEFSPATALYIQGACGDSNFLTDFQTTERCDEPARRLAESVVESLRETNVDNTNIVIAASRVAQLPTRRWTTLEIEVDRSESVRRLESEDFAGWQETIGRCMTNRPADMIDRHGGNEERAVRAMCRFNLEWTERIQIDLDHRPEVLETEVQAIRIGPLTLVANSSEFFSPFARDVRNRLEVDDLIIACYSNGRIGYLPDAYDIERKSYAAYQSPKYCNQFPFVNESGPVMCETMCQAVWECG